MHGPQDYHTRAGQRGRMSVCWRAAAAGSGGALALAAGAVPPSAAGGYTVTAAIGVGANPEGVAVDPAAGTVYVTNTGNNTVSVISAARVRTALTASIGLNPHLAIILTATLTASGRPLGSQPVSFGTGRTRLYTRDTSTRGVATCVLSGSQVWQAERDHGTIRASYPETPAPSHHQPPRSPGGGLSRTQPGAVRVPGLHSLSYPASVLTQRPKCDRSPGRCTSEEEFRIMTAVWSPDELRRIGSAEELHIATERADGTLRRGVPIWVVRVGGQVYVRTWYRRDTGWFGHAVDSRRARIDVPGLAAHVTIEDVGGDEAELRASVDTAYRAKYGRYGETSVDRMVTADAAASTLRLIPEQLGEGA